MNKRICICLLLLPLLLCACGQHQSEPSPEPLLQRSAPTPVPTPAEGPVFSEVMSRNHTVPLDGLLMDWIELYNPHETAISLGGLTLSKKADGSKASALPDVTMEAGETLLLTARELDFRISKDGESLYLFDENGFLLDQMEVPALQGNESFTREAGIVDYPSPGKANLPENAGGSIVPCGLILSEVCTANTKGFAWNIFDSSDWVELRNVGDDPILLSDYYLSDDNDELKLYRLPEELLQPGAYKLIVLTEGTAPFGLSAAGDVLYLCDSEGLIRDLMDIPLIPADCSIGREQGETLYYAAATPGEANRNGYASMCGEPAISVASGWYELGFTVTLSGEGSIYYTTDGSLPTVNSKLYQGEEILVERTMSLRARCFDGDRIPGHCVTANYFFDALPLTLDIVKISMDPKDVTSALSKGSIAKASASIALYVNGEEQFSESCGISVQGSGSRIYDKLSYQIDFRSRYGKAALDYKLFDKLDQSEFTTIALRSGSQDQCAACMRDEVISDIFYDCSPNLLTFCYRPVSLYINDAYRGVYFIRERCKAATIAYRYGVSKDSAYIVRNVDAPNLSEPYGMELFELLRYIRSHDLAKSECYEYVQARLNIDSFIDFFAALMWTNNYDFNNIRFFRSDADNGRWSLILYDNDVAFYQNNGGWVRTVYRLYLGLFNCMMRSEDFKTRYTLRMGELFRTALNEEAVIARIHELESLIDNDMHYNCPLYPGVTGYEQWKRSVTDLCYREGYGVKGVNDNVIRQYISVTPLRSELIAEAFGAEYVR